MVGKWRRRFVEQRLDGLCDKPRSGTPRSIDDERIEAMIVRTLESVPPDAPHWSSRGMARACGLSVSSVQRIWRAFGLQPHRLETFKLSTDPDFVAKVRDVVGLYVTPSYERLSEDSGLGRATVARAINILIECSYFSYRKGGGKRQANYPGEEIGRSNTYIPIYENDQRPARLLPLVDDE